MAKSENNLQGIQKAAILLIALGPEKSASIFKHLKEEEIEELTLELREQYTIVMVTHNMLQAIRVSTKTAFFLLGEMVEAGDTDALFTHPKDSRTADYVSGRFG